MQKQPRDVAVVRVSEQGDREDENFHSPREPAKARIVVQAFKRRDRGASLVEIQALLAGNGIERSIAGVASMLRSRMYLGEIHFGHLHNLKAHEPIIKERALFDRVQR